jgi:hypothetical protein
MKNFLRASRLLIPWLSLAWPFFLLASLWMLESLYPNLFCVPVNPGGKEFICGADYSHPGVRFFQGSGFIVWVLLVIAAGAAVLRGRATRAAVVAWSVSALLLASWVVIWLSLPVECSP